MTEAGRAVGAPDERPRRAAPEVAVAVFAKAPIPGFAKTRLIPRLGEDGAAALQGRLIDQALRTACAAATGPVTLWCAPDADDPELRAAAARHGVERATQAGGDLGAKMLACFAAVTPERPLVLIGTDCPALTPTDLREAAEALAAGADVVIAPAEDGGYGLIAASRPLPYLFEAMPRGTDEVAALTLWRARAQGLDLVTIRTIWDVDTPADYERLRNEGLLEGVG